MEFQISFWLLWAFIRHYKPLALTNSKRAENTQNVPRNMREDTKHVHEKKYIYRPGSRKLFVLRYHK